MQSPIPNVTPMSNGSLNAEQVMSLLRRARRQAVLSRPAYECSSCRNSTPRADDVRRRRPSLLGRRDLIVLVPLVVVALWCMLAMGGGAL